MEKNITNNEIQYLESRHGRLYVSVANMGIHIEKPKKVARRDKHRRTKDGRFRRLTNRELMEKGLRRKPAQVYYVRHDINDDSRRARMKKENIIALVALVKHHPDRMPVWLKEFMAAGGPKGPAGA